MNELLDTVPDVAVYYDSSGKAARYVESALEHLAEREAIVSTMRAFIAKWTDTLAGLAWRVDVYDAEIKIDCQYYRGQPTNAESVALLWPALEWERVEPEFSIDKDTARDWTATVDGVLLRINRAEVIRPVKVTWPGPKRVALPRKGDR